GRLLPPVARAQSALRRLDRRAPGRPGTVRSRAARREPPGTEPGKSAHQQARRLTTVEGRAETSVDHTVPSRNDTRGIGVAPCRVILTQCESPRFIRTR